MCIATLFTIPRTQKQPICPTTDEWINKSWYIYTMEYCSAIKRNKFKSVELRWMGPEPFIQSEVSQKEKNKYDIINAYTQNLKKWYWWTYLQGRNRNADIENGLVDTVGERKVGQVERITLTYIHHQRRKWQPTPVFLPGESQGWGSLGLPSMGSHRIGHDWSDLAAAAYTLSCVKHR